MSTTSNKQAGSGSISSSLTKLGSVFGLPILLVLLILVFSILAPNTFFTAFTFQSLMSSRSINALLALAVMIPLTTNNYDLSAASMLGFA